MELLRFLHRLLLGLWMGAILCFGGVIAPILFRAPMTPALGGSVVRQVVPILDAYGLCAAVLLLILEVLALGAGSWRARARIAALVGALALAVASAGWVTPRMAQLRAQAQDRISELPAADPRRAEFDRLHRASTSLMGGELLLALVAFALPLDPRRRPGLSAGRSLSF